MCDDDHGMLLISKHKRFLRQSLNVFPSAYSSQDTRKINLLYFVLASMDLLGCLKELVPDSEREHLINWIYAQQITTKSGLSLGRCGFRGSASAGAGHRFDSASIAMSYLALCCLLILGDDLSRLDRFGLLAGVRDSQLSDGSFCCVPIGAENDMRFVYCACAISSILQDFRAIRVPAALNYILSSMNYDGGFGQGPSLESHGGSTYCALASLELLNEKHNLSIMTTTFDDQNARSSRTMPIDRSIRNLDLSSVSSSTDLGPKNCDRRTNRCSQLPGLSSIQIDKLTRWCVMRQREGFNGRPDKDDDSCYTFWIGASLVLLQAEHCIDVDAIRRFVFSTQDSIIGGFSKHPGDLPDILHTYLALAGLSLLGAEELEPLHPSLNLSLRAVAHLDSIRTYWTPTDQPVTCCTE